MKRVYTCFFSSPTPWLFLSSPSGDTSGACDTRAFLGGMVQAVHGRI